MVRPQSSLAASVSAMSEEHTTMPGNLLQEMIDKIIVEDFSERIFFNTRIARVIILTFLIVVNLCNLCLDKHFKIKTS